MGTGNLLEDQQSYFVELRKQVKKYSRRKPEEIAAAIEKIKAALQQNPRIARYVGDSLPAQVQKAYIEMGGKPFLPQKAEAEAHQRHAHVHGQGQNGR